jgi:pimeloyl-ACP methyl ester carboxylesterase
MGGVDLPPEPDHADASAVVDHLVAVMAAYSGGSPHFEPDRVRALVERDVARTRSMASAGVNHNLIEFDTPRSGGFGDIAVPALVVQGEVDPLFPPAHGEALRQRIPGARLLVLPQTGHDVPPATWDLFVPALLEHTA